MAYTRGAAFASPGVCSAARGLTLGGFLLRGYALPGSDPGNAHGAAARNVELEEFATPPQSLQPGRVAPLPHPFPLPPLPSAPPPLPLSLPLPLPLPLPLLTVPVPVQRVRYIGHS